MWVLVLMISHVVYFHEFESEKACLHAASFIQRYSPSVSNEAVTCIRKAE